MKKLILGLAAAGAVVALRPVIKRRVVQKMQAHCKEMAAHCKEMMGTQRDEEMARAREERPEPVALA